MTEALSPEELEDERDFLLSSLADLEREREVGDLDDHDYAALKDDYTARAARVLRAIDAGRAAAAPAPSRNLRRTLVVGGLVAAFAVVAGVLVAQSSGRRDPGRTATGDIRQSTIEKLNEAGRVIAQDPAKAVDLYDDILQGDSKNVEALTYKGWALFLSGHPNDGLTSLIDGAQADPTYPDVHAFLAIVFFRSGLVAESGRELDRLDALKPPAQIRQLTEGLRAQVEAAVASTTTSTAAG
jgi:hypothetical protein